ncbi:MAG: dTDP-glucose 4,6-dehydratase [Verrucomicrobiota bacterium]
MAIIVTGGCGFIGSNFIRQLLIKNIPSQHIVNIDALTYAGNPSNLSEFEKSDQYVFRQGDIRDVHFVASIFEEFNIEAVIHFAAESHVDRSIDGPRDFVETNVLGTLTLLQVFKDSWEKRGKPEGIRFLHVSTDEVFGSLSSEDPAFSETTPYDPRSPYSASKAGSDHLVMAFHHTYGMPVVMTNCSNNYGPYQFPEKLIPLMVLNALEGKPLPIYGDGMNVRDWLYVEDHCRAIQLVLEKGKLGQSYNIGGNAEKPNIEIVDALCGLLDRKVPREDGKSYLDLKTFVQDRPGHDRRYAMDIQKIHSELGWEPSVSFKEGLEMTVDWYLENREWCEAITTGKYRRERLGAAG